MAKEALRDPKVINLITESLVKTTDDYFVGNCEWKDGTRSDMVLEPKNALSDPPPLIVEIQHTACYTLTFHFLKFDANFIFPGEPYFYT